MTSQCQQNKNFQLGPFFEEEINSLKMFDEIWTISVDEQYLFSRFCPGNVRWVPPMPDPLAASLPENTAGKIHDLIYVAKIGRATTELQSLMPMSYPVSCLKKKHS